MLHPAGTDPLVRAVEVGRAPCAAAVDARRGRVFVTNSADNTVSMLDARTGALLQTIAAGAGPCHLAVDGRTGRAFVVNSDDTVSVLSTATGTVVGTVQLLFIHDITVDEQRGRVIVTSTAYATGQAFVLDARNGALMGTMTVGAHAAVGPIRTAVDRRHDHVFVVSPAAIDRQGRPTRGSVSVLDGHTGRVLRRIEIGFSPRDLAIDETTDQLFVVNDDPDDTTWSGQPMWSWVPAGVRRWLSWLPWSATLPARRSGSVAILDLSRL